MALQKELDTNLLTFFLQRTYRDDKSITLIDTKIISGARSGDNFGCDIFRIKMKFICGSGKIKRRSMIVKTERNWKETKEFTRASPLFRIEVRMFSTIFSLMDNLTEEFDDKREKLWPTMYGFVPYNLIALEDMAELQYEVADRKKSLDLEHSILVLRSLARFHAMSRVLIEKGLLTKEDKGEYRGKAKESNMSKMWISLLTVLSDGIRDEWGEEWSHVSEKLSRVIDGMVSKVRDLVDDYDPRFQVMNHADVWLCNIMFRYLEYEHIPVSVRFIDFQLSFSSSFIWDVSYFMITSIVPSIRREHTTKLLSVYHESLANNLEFFGYAGYIPTLDDVKSEWKRLRFIHLLFLCLHIVTSTDVQDVFSPSKVGTHSPHEIVNVIAFTDGKAKRTIGEDLKYYHDEGVF